MRREAGLSPRLKVLDSSLELRKWRGLYRLPRKEIWVLFWEKVGHWGLEDFLFFRGLSYHCGGIFSRHYRWRIYSKTWALLRIIENLVYVWHGCKFSVWILSFTMFVSFIIPIFQRRKRIHREVT